MIDPPTVLLPVDAAAAGVAALVELDELAAVVGVAAPAALVAVVEVAALVEPDVLGAVVGAAELVELLALVGLLAGACDEQAATRPAIATPKSPFAELARRARRDHAVRVVRLRVLPEDDSI